MKNLHQNFSNFTGISFNYIGCMFFFFSFKFINKYNEYKGQYVTGNNEDIVDTCDKGKITLNRTYNKLSFNYNITSNNNN